jgi:hypothetical protein
MGRKDKPKPVTDFREQITKAVVDNGGEDRGSSLRINGWIIKPNSRGIYWHTTMDDGFKEAIAVGSSDIEDKGGKPWTPRKVMFQDRLDAIIKRILTYKSNRAKKRDSKAAAVERRQDNKRLSQKSWCKGCPTATHKNKCDFMKSFEEELGITRCTNTKFYERYWCENVEIKNAPKDKPFFGEFWCKQTGERCPYEISSIINRDIRCLGRTTSGDHFSTCPMYKGDKEDVLL